MRNTLLAVSLALSTFVCMAAPAGEYVGLSPKELQALGEPRTVTLPEQITWVRPSKKTELGVVPASYVAHWQDADGQFFLADRPVVYMKTVRGEYVLAPGGVVLPHSATGKPRFFLVQNSGGAVQRGATLAEAVASTPSDSSPFPLLDALLNWASEGNVVVLAEIDNEDVASKVRTLFRQP